MMNLLSNEITSTILLYIIINFISSYLPFIHQFCQIGGYIYVFLYIYYKNCKDIDVSSDKLNILEQELLYKVQFFSKLFYYFFYGYVLSFLTLPYLIYTEIYQKNNFEELKNSFLKSFENLKQKD